jgi:hypothetical protein
MSLTSLILTVFECDAKWFFTSSFVAMDIRSAGPPFRKRSEIPDKNLMTRSTSKLGSGEAEGELFDHTGLRKVAQIQASRRDISSTVVRHGVNNGSRNWGN